MSTSILDGSTMNEGFIHLKNLTLLSLKFRLSKAIDRYPHARFSNKQTTGNLMMSESSLPSLISEILISMVNSTTSSDGCDLALNDLVNFTSNELAKHRLNQLLVDLLYANVNFNELWQGSHDYAKVFYHKPSNREEVEFYTVYDRTVLLTYVWNNSTARLIIDRKSPERDEIYGQFYVTVNSDNL